MTELLSACALAAHLNGVLGGLWLIAVASTRGGEAASQFEFERTTPPHPAAVRPPDPPARE